jgi:hypothetical protein
VTRLRRATTQRKRLAEETRQIVEAVRASRFALARVTDQVTARWKDVETFDEAGASVLGRQPLTEAERIERLQMGLTWLARSEEENRRARGFIERALEREWKYA